MVEKIAVSEFSSLNFRTDWKLPFQKDECYEQKFLPGDIVRVQYSCERAGEYIPYLRNCGTGKVDAVPYENLLEDDGGVIAEFSIVAGDVTEDTLFCVYFAKSEGEEAVLSTYFWVCVELENTVVLKYTHRRDEFGAVFSGSRFFCFRVEGNFLPQEVSFENESEDFRDQRFVAKMLSDFTYEKRTLTIGGGFGVPNWVARKVNLIFSLSAVFVDGDPMVRSEGSSVKINLLHNDYPLYVYKIELESSDDSLEINETPVLEFSRVIDEKKKLVRRCSADEVRVYDALGVAFNPETAKMIHELDTIVELSEHFLIEIDDDQSNNSYKTPLNSVISLFAKEFLSKKHEDSADAVITFLKGLKVGNYLPGLTGTGARIDEQGYAEMTGLTLREFLEVPELRFNRVDVVSGELWNAAGYGLIENVDVVNCIATLKLEEGELAGIEVNDICRGIFHNLTGNADGSVTDGCGFQTMPGFSTSYFTPVELLEGGKSFRYELKLGTVVHPTPAMKFAVYGNFTNKSRQASAYSTRTYKRYLKEVNTWEIDPQRNIAMQFGDLSGLYINGMSMEGYSAYLNNIYFSGYMQFTPGQLEEIKGKDGYSVNLTSYDAVVAVDSEGRVDNSVYDIINVVNGNELVQTDGSQVVTTRYKIQTEIEAYQGKTRLVYDDTPGVGQYTAVLRAKGCEYAFSGGVLTITKITEDKASVEIEVNCEGAAVFTMTFTLTRVYGGVNADWPSYVFKQSVEKPEPPTGTDPRPVGWEDAPSSEGKWWMSKATISGVTGLAGPWSDPVQVTAEDGVDGGYTDFKFAKNNSDSVGPELNRDVRNPEGWYDDPPSLLSGEFLWMTLAEIGGDGSLLSRWSDPVRVSGETGRSGDWPSYVFKQSETRPETPTSSSPRPDGWEDGPSSEGKWWMSKAMISGVTGFAGAWSLPVQVTGVDGQDGSYVYYEYAVNGSETEAPASGWSSTVPSVPSGQYLWMRWGTVYPPESRPGSWTGIARVTGERGHSSTVKMIFKYALDKPATPVTGTLPADWLENVPEREKVAVTHGSVWTLKDGFRHSPTVAHGGISRNRVSFTTTKANQVVGIDLHVSSESGYDFALVGLLDNGNLDRDMNYTDRISGTGSKVVYVNVPTAGSHFVDVGYAKDSSGTSGQDKAWYQVVFPGRCWMSQTVVNSSTGYPGMWSDPVEFIPDSPDTESIYVRSEDGEKPDRPGNNVYGDDFVPALTTVDYSATVAYGVGAKVRSGSRYYKALKAGTGMPLSDGSSWKELPGWTDDPMGVSVVYRYEYMCKREKRNGVWGEWSDPKVFSHYAVDGANAVVVYKSSAEAPATPMGTSVPPEGWDVTPPERGTGEFLWVCSPVYDSEKKIIGWSVPSRYSGDKGDKGDKGDAGLQGLIYRVSEWSAGVYYRNDKDTVTDGLRYLDVVVVTNKDTGSFLCYEARAAHNGVVSSEENKPENDTFWLRMTELPPVYTPLILAENGVIRFAQSNQLLIQKKDGTVTAGMSGAGTGASGIRIWAGGSNPAAAPFRVDEDGKMVAENAEITGTINAVRGTLQRLDITMGNGNESGLFYSGDNTELRIMPGWYSEMPNNVFSLDTTQSRTMNVQVYLKRRRGNGLDRCLYVDGVAEVYGRLGVGRGPSTGFELKYPALVTEGVSNYGQFCFGNIKTISATTTLEATDCMCVSTATSDIDIYLPKTFLNPGQMILIRKCAGGNIHVKGKILNGWGSTQDSVEINNAELGIFIYNGTYWTSNKVVGF